jgi:hypothetical protein
VVRRHVVVVELRHGARGHRRRGVAASKAGEDAAEEAADGAPVHGRGLPGAPRDPLGRVADVEVEPAFHLHVHHGELPLVGPRLAGEPPDREPTARGAYYTKSWQLNLHKQGLGGIYPD